MKTHRNLIFAALAAVGFTLPALSASGQTPTHMVLIPGGSFTMGNTVSADTDITDARPVTATVSAFYMDKFEVTKALWDEVKGWSVANGYSFENPGFGKAANHPVQTVSWYDVVKWCNARSQKEGRIPAYYTNAALTQVYKPRRAAPYVNWSGGYRLPTEAVREKAARGGLSGQRYPWGNVISQELANYLGNTNSYSYDLGPNGYNAMGLIGGSPHTTPVGSFEPNGYGLYDMTGNVFEWCWDWYGAVYAGGSDPRGPAVGANRIGRGGAWIRDAAYGSRCASRAHAPPDYTGSHAGFRSVLPPNDPLVVPGQSYSLPGDSLTLSLANTLDIPSTYQWQFNETDLPGATGPALALNDVTTDDSGPYRVIISNAVGVVTSAAALVQVVERLTITSQPQSASVVPGTSVTFVVTALSPSPFTYQWQFNGADVAGETSATLALTDVQLAQDGLYTVVVSDANDSVVSQPVTLTVLVAPGFSQGPLSQSAVAGGSLTFSAAITGNPAPFTCQWRKGTSFAASTLVATAETAEQTIFLTLNNVQPSDAGTWLLYLANPAAPVLSSSSPNRTWTLIVLPDTDGDGLPDDWETSQGLNPSDPSDAMGDADGDGSSNLAEYRSGTKADDATSWLNIESIRQSSGETTLTFRAAANKTYSVEWNTGLDGPWLKLADVVAMPQDRAETVIDRTATVNRRFYRVTTPRQP